jgi:hypothetical protein
MTYHVIPKQTSTPGLVPTLEQLAHHNEVAINTADDVIYRNVNGVIVKYQPVKHDPD